MMYTELNNAFIEDSLQKQLDIIVSHTVSVYGNDCTVVLAGGFGRGEGSIRMLQGKIPVPLHDFDTYVITNRTASHAEHLAMEQNIIRDISRFIGTDLESENFALGVEVVPHRSLGRLPPDLSTYEMKVASKVLHGPDVRGGILVKSGDIALSSGAITLFHRTTALLKNVEPEFLNLRQYPVGKRLETVYECCKVYTEICTALSLLGGFYKPSYRSRAEELQKHYSVFPQLQQDLPNLPEEVQIHTRMKLASDFSSIIQRPAETWIETRRTLSIALRFFLSKFLRISAEGSWEDLCERSRGRMRSLFFRDYLSFYLSKLGIRGPPLVSAANLTFQAYDYQSFRLKMRREGKRPGAHLLSLTSPILDVYLSSALVLFALQDDGNVDEELLDIGRDYLARIFSFDNYQSNVHDIWKDSRDLCVEGQRLYFVAKQQKTVV
jgi:hypothetical protein